MAVERAVREYHAARAPLYPLPDIQRLGYLDELERYATAQGCNGMRIYGRKGWARKLPDYKMTHVLLEKVI
jgi:hypothetical protein